MPVVSGNVGEESQLTVTTTLEDKSEVIIWFSEAWGIKEGLTFSWETTVGEKGVFDFSAENGNVTMDQILIKHYTGKEQNYYMPERGKPS